MRVIQDLANHGVLGPHKVGLGTTTDIPMCGTCQYAKQTRRKTGATQTKRVPSREGALKQDILDPGDGTAVDQFEVIKKGRTFTSYGRESDSNKFVGGTLFIDMATGRIKVYCQQSLNAIETVKSKLKYEKEAREHGIIVKSYHTDNGVFTAERFQESLVQNQTF